MPWELLLFFPLPFPLPFGDLDRWRVPLGVRGVAPPLRDPPGVLGVLPLRGVPLGPLKRPGAARRGVEFLTRGVLPVFLGVFPVGRLGVWPRRLVCFLLQVPADAPAQVPPL